MEISFKGKTGTRVTRKQNRNSEGGIKEEERGRQSAREEERKEKGTTPRIRKENYWPKKKHNLGQLP